MPTTRSRNSLVASKIKDEPDSFQVPAATVKPGNATRKDKVTGSKVALKRKRAEDDGHVPNGIKKEDEDTKPPKRQSKPKISASRKKANGPTEADLEAGSKMAAAFIENRDAQRSEPLDPKKNAYGFSPGQSPYPSYSHPTPEECQEVCDILSKAHGKVQAPKTIPQPSLNNSGCGEVPSVLDALIRTRLSAATNNQNSSRAFRGLVERFGTIKEGVGKGSVDWDAVRRADTHDVFEAIKTGGLADVKSKHIKQILQMVHDENQSRRANLEQGRPGDKFDKIEEDSAERDSEVAKAANSVLSLDHLHLLDNDTAFNKLLTYPGIGPKTASCVLLFCMQRPSFAVDTHVFRLTKWLGWVPSEAKAKALAKALAKEQGTKPRGSAVTRESAYAHLDVRIPDNLKYPLHYLLIKHGRNCGWCSAKAGKDAKVGVCPLAHLMAGKGRAKGSKKQAVEDADGDVDEGDEDMGEEGTDEVD